MEPRKNSPFTEERSDRLDQPGFSTEDSRAYSDENPDTRNVSQNTEDGDDDFDDDDDELKESDFDIDDDENDEDFENDEEA